MGKVEEAGGGKEQRWGLNYKKYLIKKTDLKKYGISQETQCQRRQEDNEPACERRALAPKTVYSRCP